MLNSKADNSGRGFGTCYWILGLELSVIEIGFSMFPGYGIFFDIKGVILVGITLAFMGAGELPSKNEGTYFWSEITVFCLKDGGLGYEFKILKILEF